MVKITPGDGPAVADGCRNTGYSLIELITVIFLVSILAVYIAPRLSLDVFRQSGFTQQAAAAIRYAQKQAIASGCSVEVSITAGGCSLNWNNPGPGADPNCPADNTDIPNPGSGDNDFCRDGTPGSTADLPAVFNFSKIGRPNSAQSIDLGDRTLAVEAETGYTHEF
jgi:MSHA pilin protein MshC